jgi:hypothetical protein
LLHLLPVLPDEGVNDNSVQPIYITVADPLCTGQARQTAKGT